MKTISQQLEIAKRVNGVLGTGDLNWLGNFNMETKTNQFNIFFKRESQAKKALALIGGKLSKTPSFVSAYFKFSVTIPND